MSQIKPILTHFYFQHDMLVLNYELSSQPDVDILRVWYVIKDVLLLLFDTYFTLGINYPTHCY